jgi:hypothetical protein
LVALITHLVDAEFFSRFLMLTNKHDKHRLSLRYENFEITQNDQTYEDDNQEEGHVWTVAYQRDYSDRLSLAAEWLSIETYRYGWVYYDINPRRTETQMQLSL